MPYLVPRTFQAPDDAPACFLLHLRISGNNHVLKAFGNGPVVGGKVLGCLFLIV
jgi:hypothetical protein